MHSESPTAPRQRLREALAQLDAALEQAGLARPAAATMREHLQRLAEEDAFADVDFAPGLAACGLVYAPDAGDADLDAAADAVASLHNELGAAIAACPSCPPVAAAAQAAASPPQTPAAEPPEREPPPAAFADAPANPQLDTRRASTSSMNMRQLATLLVGAAVVTATLVFAFSRWGRPVGMVTVDREMPSEVEELVDYVRLQPSGVEGRLALGRAYLEHDDADSAIKQYEAVLKILPKHAEAMNSIAWILLTRPGADSTDAQRALKLAQEAVRLTRRHKAHILDTLAVAHFQLGHKKQALAIMDEVLRQDLEPDELEEYEGRVKKMKREEPPGHWGQQREP